MALSDAYTIAEQDARFRSSHSQDMAELDWVMRYLADDFERAYKRLRTEQAECSIATLPEPHHYLIIPRRLGQLLGRVVKFHPGQDAEPVPLEVIIQHPTEACSESDVRPADVLPFKKRDFGEETTHRSLSKHGKDINTHNRWQLRTQQGERYKWYHPFGG